MRGAIGIFGMAAGAIVVALVARYGLATSDTILDGAIAAFFFAVIAIGGIGGPAVAVHLFRTSNGWGCLWGIAAGVIAAVALLANLSNSLGAIAGRADKTIAERQQATETRKDDRAELMRLVRQRESMPAFVPTDAAAVDAAKRAADTATKNREAECEKRGPNCRQREIDEQSAATALAGVTVAKAATDQAAKLDDKADTIRKRLNKAAPVASVNPLADTLGRIFSMQADDAATWQQVATVVVVELLIAFALIAWELLTPRGQPQSVGGSNVSHQADNVVSLDSARAPGDVGKFATARLAPAPGQSIAMAELHEPYARWCLQEGYRALSQEEFAAQFSRLCEFAGVQKRMVRGRMLAMDLALSA
jgi:hypothetical protein